MNTISIKRLGLATASVFALIYLGCVFVMATVPKATAVRFFNSLAHGVDWAPIMRWDTPLWEMAVGVLEVFILGWLVGAAFAAFYNVGARPER
jgi:hypothetical protein